MDKDDMILDGIEKIERRLEKYIESQDCKFDKLRNDVTIIQVEARIVKWIAAVTGSTALIAIISSSLQLVLK